MRIMLLKTGAVAEFDDGYAARLIEQGKAVLSKVEPQTDPVTKKEETDKPKETKSIKKDRKG